MVYFVRVGDTGPIKIGFTDSPSVRFHALNRTHGGELVILGVTNGNRQTEKQLHERFTDSHHSGEWFHPTPDLLEFIEKNSGPWDGEDSNAMRSLLSLKGSESFEAWLDDLVHHACQGTRALLVKNSLREFAEKHGFARPQPRR